MAGSYDDAPSRRMAHDADGTVGVTTNGQGGYPLVNISTANLEILNNEQDNGANFRASSGYVAFIFPELRNLDGIFCVSKWTSGSVLFYVIESSPDTTNGEDGTWTTQIGNYTDHGNADVYTKFRDNITSMSVTTEKGVRINFSGGSSALDKIFAIHIYGVISAGETPDRIIFLDTENSDAVFTKPLDYGDIPRGQTSTRTFKIKNNSSTKTINTIQVTAEDLYLNAGDWYEFGDDGVAYQGTHAVGNLGPGVTELVYLKHIIPDGETLGVQTGRIKVSHASVT